MLWISAESLKKQLRIMLGLAERSADGADDETLSAQKDWERTSQLQATYMALRMHERQKLEEKFEAFFSRCDDVKVDIAPLLEALRQECRISESGRALSDSLWFVELLERELASADPEIPKDKVDEQAPRESVKKRAGEVRKCLISLFSTKCSGVRDLAARLDTIHKLAPAYCAGLHQATISLGGSTCHREEWEELFLEPHRLAADNATNAEHDANFLLGTVRQYQWICSLERAFQVDRATASSSVIEAMLAWPFEARRGRNAEYARAFFFGAFPELPQSEQEGVLPCLREAIFEELIPQEDFVEPSWNYDDSERDR